MCECVHRDITYTLSLAFIDLPLRRA